MAVLIRQAKVVDRNSPFHLQTVDIVIDKGIIKTIGPSIPEQPEQVIEGEDLCISTGWTDVFADYREPGYEHKETIHSGLESAAAGGFTDVMTVPNTQPAVSTKSVVQYIINQAKGHTVNIHPLGSVTKDIEGKNLAEMLDMHAHGAIAFTDGWKPVQNANILLKALEYVRAFNGTVIQIPQDSTLAAGGLMHEGPQSTRLGMPGIPAISETLMLYRDIELLRYTQSRLHVTGISCAESVDMIRKAKEQGLNITCSVTPYHLVFNDEVMHSYNSVYKVTPPIRSEADRKALIEGLKDGTIDCITSHHRPQEWDAKAKEFEYASDGMNMQEWVFPVVFSTIGKEVGLERIIEALSLRPKQIFGLETGTIDLNKSGSYTVFSTGQITDKKQLRSLSSNNPFTGSKYSGKVVAVVNGEKLSMV